MSRNTAMPGYAVQAHINLNSLKHNLDQVRQRAPESRVLAVIKANAYGHGLVRVANALDGADAFAVARLEEAELLRSAGLHKPVVLLEGVQDVQSLAMAADLSCQIVVHSAYQLDMLCKLSELKSPMDVWLKLDTGMHRLGISPEEFSNAWKILQESSAVSENVRLMTHLACADEPKHPATQQQLTLFQEITHDINAERSIANSAAILSLPGTYSEHNDVWVRPGVMLYGVSPFAEKTAKEQGLKPVMTLSSKLIAVNQCKKGDAIGYGGTWVCPEGMPVGVVAAGYGDGYPRHVDSETQVLVNGERVPVVGRVSMDMITVDLRNQSSAKVGDPVILWGEGLPVEEVALHAGTIAYELLCQVTSRVAFVEE